jgi:hypothetical protein
MKRNKKNFATRTLSGEWECLDFVSAPFVDGGCKYWLPRGHSIKCIYLGESQECLNVNAIRAARRAEKKADNK